MKVSATLGLSGPNANQAFDAKLKDYLEYLGISKIKFKDEAEEFGVVFKAPTLAGIEVEVENIKSEISLPFFWSHEGDGSLRQGGMEFKSIPLEPAQAFSAIVVLWHMLKTKKADFSWRTSVHFHINALGMDERELKRFITLSLATESVFFRIAGIDREQSNYCVPLCQSTVLEKIQKYLDGNMSLKQFFNYWNTGAPNGDHHHGAYKYAAVNFSRLGDLGTVEFRHFGGCSELNKVKLFLALLFRMYETACSIGDEELSSKIKGVESQKSYSQFLREIFGVKLYQYLDVPDFNKIAGSFSRVKEILVKRPKFDPVSPESSMAGYGEVVHKRRASAKEASQQAKK